MKNLKIKIADALNKAPMLTEKDAHRYIYSKHTEETVKKAMELSKRGMEGVKGLWLFTTYKDEDYANLLIDFVPDKTNEEQADIISSVFDYIPHDVCHSLTRDVLGETPGIVCGEESDLVREILEGRVITIFSNY